MLFLFLISSNLSYALPLEGSAVAFDIYYDPWHKKYDQPVQHTTQGTLVYKAFATVSLLGAGYVWYKSPAARNNIRYFFTRSLRGDFDTIHNAHTQQHTEHQRMLNDLEKIQNELTKISGDLRSFTSEMQTTLAVLGRQVDLLAHRVGTTQSSMDTQFSEVRTILLRLEGVLTRFINSVAGRA